MTINQLDLIEIKFSTVNLKSKRGAAAQTATGAKKNCQLKSMTSEVGFLRT